MRHENIDKIVVTITWRHTITIENNMYTCIRDCMNLIYHRLVRVVVRHYVNSFSKTKCKIEYFHCQSSTNVSVSAKANVLLL